MDHLPVCEYYVMRVQPPRELSTLTVGEKADANILYGSRRHNGSYDCEGGAVSPQSSRPSRGNAVVIEQAATHIPDRSGGPVYSGLAFPDRGRV